MAALHTSERPRAALSSSLPKDPATDAQAKGEEKGGGMQAAGAGRSRGARMHAQRAIHLRGAQRLSHRTCAQHDRHASKLQRHACADMDTPSMHAGYPVRTTHHHSRQIMTAAGMPYCRYSPQCENAAFRSKPVHTCSGLPSSFLVRHIT